MRGKSAFTLVELLVVIAIISTLAAMLLPALSEAMWSARYTECLNRKKQVAMVEQNYNYDFNDWYAPGRFSRAGYVNGNAWVTVINNLYLSYSYTTYFETFSGYPARRRQTGTIFDCPLYVGYHTDGAALCAVNDLGGASYDIARNGGLHGMYGQAGFSRTSPDWNGGDATSLTPYPSDATVSKYWTIRKTTQLKSSASTVPDITDAWGSGGGYMFNKVWRTLAQGQHGFHEGDFDRVVVWADMHGNRVYSGLTDWNSF